MESMMTPKEVADLLSVSLPTLARWRMLGTGPQFTKFKDVRTGIIRYEQRHVREFIEQRQRENTIEIEREAERVAAVNMEQARAVDQIFKEQRATIKRLEGEVAALKNRGEAAKGQEGATIRRLEGEITVLKSKLETAVATAKVEAEVDRKKTVGQQEASHVKSQKIHYLTKELKNKREECQRHKATIKRLEEAADGLADQIERLKREKVGTWGNKAPERVVVKPRVDVEGVRACFLKETRRWLMANESPHQLLARLKALGEPKEEGDDG
jgi:hypothetical protein